MQATTQRCTLAIESGPQAGASLAVLPGLHRIGSGLDCDIVVADPLLAAAHFALEDTPAATLRALDAEVRVNSGPVLQPGDAYPIRRSLRFTAGGTQFHLSSPTPDAVAATTEWRPRTGTAVILAIAAATFLTVQATPAGTVAIASLPAIASTPDQPPVLNLTHPPAAVLTAALTDQLAAAGLAGVHPTVSADGTMEAAGIVSPTQQAAWSGVKRWFDGAYGAHTVLVDRVTLSTPAAPLSIAAVHPGASPFVIDRSGQKLFPGSILPGGWVVDAIEPTHVLVRRNGQALTVRF